MQTYTQVYFDFFGFDISDWIPCEVCQKRQATEIHHIEGRLGELLTKIENLVAICRLCHEKYGQKTKYLKFLQDIHNKYMKEHGKDSKNRSKEL